MQNSNMEIERKFLVKSTWRPTSQSIRHDIVQGYLSTDKDCTIRIRLDNLNAYLTVKGATEGISRPEFELPIPVRTAEQLLQKCDKILAKTRYVELHHDCEWTIDVFKNKLEGLILAEIELPHEDFEFKLPAFIEKEVSHDRRYYNAILITEGLPT